MNEDLFKLIFIIIIMQVPQFSPSFDVSRNNDWDRRHRSLLRFIRAVNSVIIQNRSQRKLESLSIADLKAARDRGTGNFSINVVTYIVELSADINPATAPDWDKLALDELSLNLSPPSFPSYIDCKKSQEKVH